jgi:hypothetical protein
MQEAEVGRLQAEAGRAKRNTLLKNKLKQKGLEERLKWQSTCLPSARP